MRRKRTTKIYVVVETTIKDVSKLLKLHESTVAGRYHRIHDKYPRRAVMLEALAVRSKKGAYK